MATLQFKLNGSPTPPPVQWESIEIQASFDDENTLPNLETSKLKWANESARVIIDWIAAGNPGIFEGIPLEIVMTNPSTTFTAFTGIVDTANDLVIDPANVQVSTNIVKSEGIQSVDERARAVTFGLLQEQGFITSADFVSIPYLIEPETDFIELALLGTTIYLMLQQLADAVRTIAKDIAAIAGESAGGIIGPVGAAILAVANIAINIVYSTVIILYLKDLAEELLDNLISPIRYFKAMTLRTMLEKGAQYLGFTFVSSITELDTIHYLPSQVDDGGLTASVSDPGIPQPGDYGYVFEELLILCREQLFRARTQVDSAGRLVMEPLNSPHWQQNSTFVLPNVLDEVVQYNANELRSNFKLAFALDTSDFHTINNSTDRSYEIITVPVVTNNPKNVLTKGLEAIDIPCSLPTRKDELSAVEELVKRIGGIIDTVVDFFFGNSNFAQRVQDRVGMLKISNRTFAKPKLIPFDGANIPLNHRQIWSAVYLWNNFHNERSFVDNNNGNQYRLHKEITIPFSLDNLLQVLYNNFFTAPNGARGKIESIKYLLDGDMAVIDYRIQEVYASNLTEIKIAEP